MLQGEFWVVKSLLKGINNQGGKGEEENKIGKIKYLFIMYYVK